MVYIAGPISHGDLCDNINRATDAFNRLAIAGLAPLCPQWSCFSTGAFVSPTSGKVYAKADIAGSGLAHSCWIEIDLVFVERSDAVLRLSGQSAGADCEVEHARNCGVPVFTSVEEVIAWASRPIEEGFTDARSKEGS